MCSLWTVFLGWSGRQTTQRQRAILAFISTWVCRVLITAYVVQAISRQKALALSIVFEFTQTIYFLFFERLLWIYVFMLPLCFYALFLVWLRWGASNRKNNAVIIFMIFICFIVDVICVQNCVKDWKMTQEL